MSLLVECPSCKYRNSTKAKLCRKCDYRIGKASSKCYWIDYRANGKRRRERIGTSKRASEHRLREVLSAITEGRHITQNKNAQVTLRQLRDWYYELTEVMQKRSYPDIKTCINNVINKLGEDILVSELELSMVENYRKYRLIETTRLKRPVKPSTINRDVANFRAMLNKAVDYKIIDSNPIGRIKQLEENNVRKRVLSTVEFERLYECCPASIKGPVLIAFYLPMRRAEILNMQWEEIDFVHEFLRLGRDRTKNKEGRVIPLHPRIKEYLQGLPHPIHGGYVFELRKWKRKAYLKAVKEAGLCDFTFHDLRHCAINNLRLAGNDHFLIKQMSGHKTDSAFRRYNLVTEEEISRVKWYEEEKNVDTYMDTNSTIKD